MNIWAELDFKDWEYKELKMKNIGKIVEDYKPKYQDIELLVSYNWLEMEIIGKLKWKEVKKNYGKRMILSVKDYEDTKTTSIIIDGE